MALEDALENGLSGVREKKAIFFYILIIALYLFGQQKLKVSTHQTFLVCSTDGSAQDVQEKCTWV